MHGMVPEGRELYRYDGLNMHVVFQVYACTVALLFFPDSKKVNDVLVNFIQ